MEYILIVLCLMGSAFFSGTEIAYTSLSKLKIKKERENPRGIQRLVLFIYDHFDNALSTLLIGNNLVNIAATSIATVMAVKPSIINWRTSRMSERRWRSSSLVGEMRRFPTSGRRRFFCVYFPVPRSSSYQRPIPI